MQGFLHVHDWRREIPDRFHFHDHFLCRNHVRIPLCWSLI